MYTIAYNNEGPDMTEDQILNLLSSNVLYLLLARSW